MTTKIPPLTTIFYHITDKCNLRCKHCWVEAGNSSAEESLSLAEANNVVTQALALGLKAVKLTGGEPFLVPWILDFVECCSNKGIECTFETNGTLITPKVIQKLVQCKIGSVSVSLDGADANLHENIRGVTGCFDLTIEALNHLVEAGIPTIVVSAVCKENLHGVENIITLVQKLGVNTIKFNPVVPIGRGHHLEKNGDLLASREYIELFNTIKRAQKRVQIPVQMHFPLLACEASMLGNNMYYDCCVGNMLGLMSDGGLCLCGLAYTNKRAIYANVRNTKLKDIWCDNPPKIIRDLRGDLPNNLTGVCGKCMFKYICVGGCRAKALDRYGSVLGPNPICQKLFEEGLVPESRLIYN